jgi:hypothetical protein
MLQVRHVIKLFLSQVLDVHGPVVERVLGHRPMGAARLRLRVSTIECAKPTGPAGICLIRVCQHAPQPHMSAVLFGVLRPRRVALILALLFMPHSVRGQFRTVIVDDSNPCTDCRIRLERIASIGNEGAGYVGEPWAVQLWQGMWAVTHLAKPGSISLYSRNGDFLKDVGRRGEGPGEYKMAGRTAVRGDTLFVFDPDLQRVTYYTSTDKHAGSFKVGVRDARAMEVLKDGRILFTGRVRTTASVGYPLHVTSRNSSVRSFGAVKPIVDPARPHAHLRASSMMPDGSILTARFTEYLLEQWDSNGRKIAEWRRNVPWFSPHGKGGIRSPTEPPNPLIDAVYVDDNMLAWVMLGVPDKNWKAAVRQKGVLQGRTIYEASNNEYMDALIEVIDLKTGKLIARMQMDARALSASAHGIIVTEAETVNSVRLDVWRPQLIRGER